MQPYSFRGCLSIVALYPILSLLIMKLAQATAWLAFAGVLLSQPTQAQTVPTDSTFLSAAKKQVEQRYAQAIQDQSQLYNGAEYFNYTRYYQEVRGHQFFMSPTEQPGSVYYGGHQYANVPLLYDIRLDQVIIKQPTSSFSLKLVDEQVKNFSIHGHTFIRLEKDSVANQNITPGYYDLLLDKSIKLLAKHTKRMQAQPSQNTTRAEFTAADRYFIQKGNTYYAIKSKGSIISLFPESRKQLQKFARTNKLSFNKETREADIIQLLRYYTTLSPQETQASATTP
ncbi:hypothetical protein GCM10027346_33740 [Hymenobacter seoulensis]